MGGRNIALHFLCASAAILLDVGLDVVPYVDIWNPRRQPRLAGRARGREGARTRVSAKERAVRDALQRASKQEDIAAKQGEKPPIPLQPTGLLRVVLHAREVNRARSRRRPSHRTATDSPGGGK
ncbi:hypothetical protein MRB53_041540 [Persea americana]|nr:hypothetical protein MRB53_041540 [Persea americana]